MPMSIKALETYGNKSVIKSFIKPLNERCLVSNTDTKHF